MVTDGQTLLSVDADGTPWLWYLGREEAVHLPADRVNTVALVSTHDGPLVVTGAEHGRLRRWDLGATRPVRT